MNCNVCGRESEYCCCDECIQEMRRHENESLQKDIDERNKLLLEALSTPELKITVSSNEKGHGSEIDIEGASWGHVLCGDIIAEGKDVTIERKKIGDFLDSSTDIHMWNQAKSMRENYKRQVVIIVGHFPDDVDYRHKKKIPHGYAAIASLIRQGITVLNVKNDAMLSTLSLAILKEAEHRDPTIPIKRVEKDGKHSVIQAIEGVGQQKAKALIEKYFSVRNLASISIAELSEFKVNNRKLGEKTAKRIIETLN